MKRAACVEQKAYPSLSGPAPRRESDLDIAERHVAEAEVCIARQEEIINKLERDNHPDLARMARHVLETFGCTLNLMRVHLIRLRASNSAPQTF
jgi:hypothetical protein